LYFAQQQLAHCAQSASFEFTTEGLRDSAAFWGRPSLITVASAQENQLPEWCNI